MPELFWFIYVEMRLKIFHTWSEEKNRIKKKDPRWKSKPKKDGRLCMLLAIQQIYMYVSDCLLEAIKASSCFSKNDATIHSKWICRVMRWHTRSNICICLKQMLDVFIWSIARPFIPFFLHFWHFHATFLNEMCWCCVRSFHLWNTYIYRNWVSNRPCVWRHTQTNRK